MLNDLDAARLISVKWSNYIQERNGGPLGVPELDKQTATPEEHKVTQQ